MANAKYKSTDALMRHLRDNGISISGSSQKQQLINTGYFHGYKGYRFFVSSANRLPFTSYNEINATIQYDTKLKSLLYGKMMFIETALKNIALNTIMEEIGSSKMLLPPHTAKRIQNPVTNENHLVNTEILLRKFFISL